MKLEELLQELDLPGNGERPALNDNGICTLVLNGSASVSVEKSTDDQGFYLYSVVGVIPAAKEKKLVIEAMSGNLFGKETGKACLGYLPDSSILVLFQYIQEDGTNLSSFKHLLEEFLSYLNVWNQKLESSRSLEALLPQSRMVSSAKGLQIFFA